MNGYLIPPLPDEILLLVCQELGNDRDFATLYGCAQAASLLADPALRTMYLLHEFSPSFVESDEDSIRPAVGFENKVKQQEQSFRRWTVLWRSIIASSLDPVRTYRPYCRYLRILDFRNLATMLEDLKFSSKVVQKAFFTGSLNHLYFLKQDVKRQVIDVVKTINEIGETIIPKAYQLEEIAGHLSPGFLARWLTKSPKLQNLVLYNGDALSNGAGSAIAEHCDDFKNLTVREWSSSDADQVFADFLNEMNENTLQDFEMISFNNLGPQSFEAFGRHSSLKDLRLANLGQEAVLNLHKLKGCTQLELLILHDNYGTVQLEALNNDIFLEVVDWLSSCDKLRDVTLRGFFDGPAIFTQVLVAPKVRLAKLSLEGYTVRLPSAAAFHSALSEQKSLQVLSLKGNSEDATPDDLSIMVEAIAQLTDLRELVLKEISDLFSETHIMTIALSLPYLQELDVGGQEVSEDLLSVFAQMKHLTSLSLNALTQFSSDAILEFLSNLDPVAQKGFVLELNTADPEWDLSESEREVIQEYIRQNLGGRFAFWPWREAESIDSEDD